MDFLTRFGIEKSRLTILAMIALLLLGAMTYSALPKRENPALTIRNAIVLAQFPGMAPERVEDLIAIPLERAAKELGAVEDISTLVTLGQAQLTVAMSESLSKAELDSAFQDLRTKMEEAASDLPDGTYGPFINTNYGDVAIATVAVTGEGFSYAEIAESAERLQQGFYKIDGVTKVSLSGVQDERIWLEIDTRKLATVGVQFREVVADLQAQNVIMPAGQIDAAGTTITMEANGNLTSIEDIENVLTQLDGTGELVRLRDLMTVRRGYVDPIQKPVYFNGAPAVMVSVEMSDDRDIQKLGATLRQDIAALEQFEPIGFSFNISTFQDRKSTRLNSSH